MVAAAMQRPGEVVAQLQPNGSYVECVVHQRLRSVKIRWNHAGRNVAIAGSWDNWESTFVINHQPMLKLASFHVKLN